ncbi:nuclear transport factor 2 family protein [Rhodococcus sp. P-2]|uniref:nuclear transport factor 2 family protein n=1 Tax=Rhodococcus TaxID=1827 RepID=UPI000BB355B9|nr:MULTISPECIES: nuclear transport factor 2 family protein [Rhodococcus]PBI97171.1 hypothetical protein BKP42_31500 [Rhodococcus erythropolis]QQM21505.1 nuclear transport factor 2 family protein [Rhodococcus sp. P-2]
MNVALLRPVLSLEGAIGLDGSWKGRIVRPVGCVVVALVATVSISACNATAPETGPSSVPRDASPTTVVHAFLDALNAHDVEAAKRLLSPEFEQRFESSADSWFTNIVSITNIEVGDPVPQVPEGNGMSGYQQGVQVLTHFDLEQRTVVSMHNGATSWGYMLARESDTDPWLIVSQGMG